MIKSAGGSAELLREITKPAIWRGGVQILKKEEEGARLFDRCEAKRKEWAKHRRCDEEIHRICKNKPWRNEDLKKYEEALPRLKEGDLKKRYLDCTKQRQEWDATDSTRKFSWI